MDKLVARIKELISDNQFTPSQFADYICINKSRLSHILNGRNNPTLDLVNAILFKFDKVNPDWLIAGNGPKLKGENIVAQKVQIPDAELLADEKTVEKQKNGKASIDAEMDKKDVKLLIVYFTDNTYRVFKPSEL